MQYEVETELATVVQGSVLLCRDRAAHALVVVKRVVATRDSMAEARLHLRLPRHRHVLRMRRSFHVDNMLHMVLDYCPNGDLFAELRRHTRLPSSTALQYMTQIASAVLHLHTQRVAHRDLTLENILLDANGACQVCDFGLAVVLPVTCNEPVGKVPYMAPEVYAGDDYDPCKADVWALGVMLFMLVTGVPPIQRPCRTDKRFVMLEAYGVHSLVNLWHMDALFSESMMELIEMMLEVDPIQRLSMKEVTTALRIELKACKPSCMWDELWQMLL
ncbi:hypothetical protein DYB25_010771 [Aphanomyces astaci]|uniref:Protein kinase domain-containing protein n=1 Tax=Aphanomyces astaci TaxID=112090 RepID=A0A397BB52_APHAT|nr:hypothetical protein DYB25_010771 [Aphanomyces astaci]RHY16617.1 hypothetical protein DYB36_001812 [Aphanomyces astaci]RHY51859.1 hypothetical protein DYB30_011378 [Aphanomyces astaci]RHY55162.1 hypothetical protein DYB38_003950 [Aphanomyces astaci]RHY76958.1 hypothetical protein DYB34_002048 [Aphanomyces astaci]